jgi:hypothetical protein
MQGMQSNVPVSNAASSLGNAIMQAVATWHMAVSLTDEQLAEAEKAKDIIAQASELKSELTERESGLDNRETALHDAQASLKSAQALHDSNMQRLLNTQKILEQDIGNFEQDKSTHETAKKAFASEWQKLLDAQEQLRADQADITKREQVLQNAAAALHGNLKLSVNG